MSEQISRIILNFDDPLLKQIDAEKERTGATRNRTVMNILEKYFAEQKQKQRIYDEWFMAEVARGVKSAQTEPLVDHEAAVERARETIAKAKERHATAEVV